MRKLKKPSNNVAVTLIVSAIGLTAIPSISKSSCTTGDLGDCEAMVDGSHGCTAGGWFDDCGNGEGKRPIVIQI